MLLYNPFWLCIFIVSIHTVQICTIDITPLNNYEQTYVLDGPLVKYISVCLLRFVPWIEKCS